MNALTKSLNTATMLAAATMVAATLLSGSTTFGQDVIARTLSADGDLNLTNYTNPFDTIAGGTAFTSGFDAFAIYQRGSEGFISFDLLDDSTTFTTDTQGIVQAGNTAPFFGIEDTANPDNPSTDPSVASFTFDTSSVVGPATLSFDLAAMGDYEDGIFSSNIFGAPAGTPGIADTLEFSVSVDGGPALLLADATVLAGPDDAEITRTYTLESGTEVTLNDPLNLNTLAGSIALSNEFQNFEFLLADAGDSVTFEISAYFDGSNEAVALQNLTISGASAIPEPTSLMLLSLGGVALLTRRRRSD